jgi:3-oxoacid CoA-transferase subunit B
VQCVNRIVTNLAVIDITKNGFLLKERAPDVNIDQIVKKTEGNLFVPDYVKEMVLN